MTLNWLSLSRSVKAAVRHSIEKIIFNLKKFEYSLACWIIFLLLWKKKRKIDGIRGSLFVSMAEYIHEHKYKHARILHCILNSHFAFSPLEKKCFFLLTNCFTFIFFLYELSFSVFSFKEVMSYASNGVSFEGC